MEVHDDDDEDDPHYCEKKKLIKIAEATLNRLNNTINSMKWWTNERASLQSDILRLKLALENNKDNELSSKVILVSNDPLIKQQTKEIRRLETSNNNMKMKLKYLNNVLFNTKRAISWNVNRKVRSEMAKLNYDNAENRLLLANEIIKLRKQVNNTIKNKTINKISHEFDVYAKSNCHIDNLLSSFAKKIINIINELSSNNIIIKLTNSFDRNKNLTTKNSLIHEDNEEIELVEINLDKIDDNLMNNKEKNDNKNMKFNNTLNENIKDSRNKFEIEKEFLLNQINKILFEEEKKINALKRDASCVRRKLSIEKNINNKLNIKIQSMNNEFDLNNDKFNNIQIQLDQTRHELLMKNEKLKLIENNLPQKNIDGQLDVQVINEQNLYLNNQLELEKLTTREALMDLKKSLNEIDKLKIEMANLNKNITEMKKENSKLKIEKNEMIDNFNCYKKKMITLNDEKNKENELLNSKINNKDIKLNKLSSDIKKLQLKYDSCAEKLKIIENDNVNLKTQANNLLSLNDDLKKQNECLINKTVNISEYLKEETTKNYENDEKIIENDRKLQEVLLNNSELQSVIDKMHEKNSSLKLELKDKSNELNIKNDKLLKMEKIIGEFKNNTSILSELKKLNEDYKLTINKMNDKIKLLSKKKSSVSICTSTVNDELNVRQISNLLPNVYVYDDSLINNLHLRFKQESQEFLTMNSNQQTIDMASKLSAMSKHKDDTIKYNSINYQTNITNNQHIDHLFQNIKSHLDNIMNRKINKPSNDQVNQNDNNDINEKEMLQRFDGTENELRVVKNELFNLKIETTTLKNEINCEKKKLYDENIALKEELAKLRKIINKKNHSKLNKH